MNHEPIDSDYHNLDMEVKSMMAPVQLLVILLLLDYVKKHCTLTTTARGTNLQRRRGMEMRHKRIKVVIMA